MNELMLPNDYNAKKIILTRLSTLDWSKPEGALNWCFSTDKLKSIIIDKTNDMVYFINVLKEDVLKAFPNYTVYNWSEFKDTYQ